MSRGLSLDLSLVERGRTKPSIREKGSRSFADWKRSETGNERL
jgi:hypothetical protein